MGNNHIDSWMSTDVFMQQLESNISNLNSNKYPQHWFDFINILDYISKEKSNLRLLDVGCGAGYYYEICKRHFPKIYYFGIDFSEYAIDIARKYWSENNFDVLGYQSLHQDYISKFDVMHAGALLDVLPNGDDALDFLLSLGSHFVIIGRVDFVSEPSYSYDYDAYGKVFTRFKHNLENFTNTCREHNYVIQNLNNTILLKKKL